MKVTESVVDIIRDYYSYQGQPIKEIAKHLNLSDTTIRKVIDEWAMCPKEELLMYSFCIKYLIKEGKIPSKTRGNGTYLFDLTDQDLTVLEEEIIPNFEANKSIQELTDYYKKLLF